MIGARRNLIIMRGIAPGLDGLHVKAAIMIWIVFANLIIVYTLKLVPKQLNGVNVTKYFAMLRLCVELWGLAHAICNPFTRNFQWERCQKFLFDCELISDFPDDKQVDTGIVVATDEVLTKAQLNQQVNEAALLAEGKLSMPTEKMTFDAERKKIAQQNRAPETQSIPVPSTLPMEDHAEQVPEFFVGQVKKQGNRIVLDRVKIEPGEVIGGGRAGTTIGPTSFVEQQQQQHIAVPDSGFRPDELLKLATDVGTGKLKPFKRDTDDPPEIASEEWSSKFMP
ncbi:unnamed protein product, partial [Mesorhabditis spiculigera]